MLNRHEVHYHDIMSQIDMRYVIMSQLDMRYVCQINMRYIHDK